LDILAATDRLAKDRRPQLTKQKSELEASYDRVAEEYAAEYSNELERKPFDCEVLDEFAASVRDQGRVCEIGCGPGHISRYLQDRGVSMFGIDLSEEMVNCAQRINPDISFLKGNMLSLELPDASVAAIVCFYTIIHLQRNDVVEALNEMNRVLEPGGHLLLSFHGGEGELHRAQWYDKPVSIDVTLFAPDEMANYLTTSGFEVVKLVEREPYEFEYPTRRIYLFARKRSRSQ
jgi:ubiquinone/menaquinone biosynthesis C-methylase UbiE